MLKKSDRIIASVREWQRCLKSHKFGINSLTLWSRILLWMPKIVIPHRQENAKVAFKILPDGKKAP